MSTNVKKEYSAPDAQPVIIYAKSDPDSEKAYPITSDFFMKGMYIPRHDTEVIDETDLDNVTIVYKLNNATVATKTISISGKITTISITYA